MPENVFNVFMSEHPPIAGLVDHADKVLWGESALNPVVKERLQDRPRRDDRVLLLRPLPHRRRAGPILERDAALSEADRRKAELAEEFARAALGDGGPPTS